MIFGRTMTAGQVLGIVGEELSGMISEMYTQDLSDVPPDWLVPEEEITSDHIKGILLVVQSLLDTGRLKPRHFSSADRRHGQRTAVYSTLQLVRENWSLYNDERTGKSWDFLNMLLLAHDPQFALANQIDASIRDLLK